MVWQKPNAGKCKRSILFCRNSEDVELIIGGAMEKAATGAVIGPTLACVMALQFANLKKSDR